MNKLTPQRQFNSVMRDINCPFLPSITNHTTPVRVAFVLQEHFSLMAFTAAVDAMVTANLVCSSTLFEFSTFGINTTQVKSDLAIEISTTDLLAQLPVTGEQSVDILIVCGGLRCNLAEHEALSTKLRTAVKADITLGGLWNGTIALAHAGVLDNQPCTLHPDNHAYMNEHFTQIKLVQKNVVIANKRATSAGPNSALEMMLNLIEQIYSSAVVRAIREILSSDRGNESNQMQTFPATTHNPEFPLSLNEVMTLMRVNIVEPLSIDELAQCIGSSRRKIERLFRTYLETTPSRYYLELRITHAHRLILQSDSSITSIAVACGFISSPHFSHCFKDYFGITPSQARQRHKNKM